MNELLDTTIKLVNDFKLENLSLEGQNFIVDEDILDKEIEHADLRKDDIVVDIGAGFGYITARVAKICRVIAIEKDFRLYSYMVSTLELNKNVELINQDVMEMVLPEFTKIVSNPPYSIVDRLLLKIARYDFEGGVMILPNTLAESLASSREKDETVLSFSLRQFMDFELICDVQKDKFYPPPRVTSKMVKFIKKEEDFVQRVLDEPGSLVKNAILAADQTFNSNTKRTSRERLADRIKEIEDISNKTVKQLNLEELKRLVRFLERNY
ncbi:MAG: methyltransferase [Candidatus Parvarchaeota archaeon]|nr:methyltransferase [Candidatus Parvarchaeota archaeon]